MEEKENNLKTPVSHKRRNLLIAAASLLAVIIVIVVLILVKGHSKSKTEKEDTSEKYKGELAELHVFPPIEFADSLYYKKVAVSYGDNSPKDVFYYEKDDHGQPTNVRVHETHYYPGGKKITDGNVSENKRDGLWYAYHKNGNVKTMAHYKDGKENGRYTVYHENGNVRYTGYYKDGIRVGEWKYYDQNEKLVYTEKCGKKK